MAQKHKYLLVLGVVVLVAALHGCGGGTTSNPADPGIGTETSKVTSSAAPATPPPAPAYTQPAEVNTAAIPNPWVMLVEDVVPWGSVVPPGGAEANVWAMLQQGIPHWVVPKEALTDPLLVPSVVGKVIIGSVQNWDGPVSAFYSFLNQPAVRRGLEMYVAAGGVLECHAAEYDWGNPMGEWLMPFGFQVLSAPTDAVAWPLPLHTLLRVPLVVPVTPTNWLNGWNFSAHGIIVRTQPTATPGLPRINAKTIQTAVFDVNTGGPVLMVVRCGKGVMIITTQAVEWAAGDGGVNPPALPRRNAARNLLQNLVVYRG